MAEDSKDTARRKEETLQELGAMDRLKAEAAQGMQRYLEEVAQGGESSQSTEVVSPAKQRRGGEKAGPRRKKGTVVSSEEGSTPSATVTAAVPITDEAAAETSSDAAGSSAAPAALMVDEEGLETELPDKDEEEEEEEEAEPPEPLVVVQENQEPACPPPPVPEMRRSNSDGAAAMLAAGGAEDSAMKEMIAKLEQELAAKDDKLANTQHALSEAMCVQVELQSELDSTRQSLNEELEKPVETNADMMAAITELSTELEARDGQLQNAQAALEATRKKRRLADEVSMAVGGGEEQAGLDSIPELGEGGASEAETEAEEEKSRLEKCDSVSILSQLGGLFSVLNFSNKMAMMMAAPHRMLKAGSVIKNMERAGFDDDAINHVVRALFIEQTREAMQLAFTVFDKDGTGCLVAAHFRQTLMLLGEEVPEEMVRFSPI